MLPTNAILSLCFSLQITPPSVNLRPQHRITATTGNIYGNSNLLKIHETLLIPRALSRLQSSFSIHLHTLHSVHDTTTYQPAEISVERTSGLCTRAKTITFLCSLNKYVSEAMLAIPGTFRTNVDFKQTTNK